MTETLTTPAGSILLRPSVAADLPFVKDTWKRSFRDSPFAGPIPNHLYHPVYGQVLDYLMGREDVRVEVAANPESDGQVFGYVVSEEGFDAPCLHWIYVKRVYRGYGVAKSLLKRAGIPLDSRFYYTFKGPQARKLAQKAPLAIHRQPLARKKKHRHERRHGQESAD